jgi:hypothetical protein
MRSGSVIPFTPSLPLVKGNHSDLDLHLSYDQAVSIHQRSWWLSDSGIAAEESGTSVP